jgi:hypothetical protein
VAEPRNAYFELDDEPEQELDPRWRDCHTLPDEWLLNKLRPLFRRWRYPKWVARYALRCIHCLRDGQCIFRARHRGACCWGDDDA